ncbi:hypothetical protein A2680_01615 [Candidatus Kaiserbacteria bacterium RIFCSPHIGHO2_01_FULL_55_37]|nr:MAG: hypothetical protein A2680_01615 [Candidatus Kaiserbacteria bacterium RIFCSPHIGHO2_01_FULL_55_37]
MPRAKYRVFSVAVMVLSTIVFVYTLTTALWYVPTGEASSAEQPTLAVSSSSPARLSIPALHIDASVQKVGVKADGSMATPSNFADVAWYKYGTVPGQLGSAVISGHVDNGLALAGVFKHLPELRVGDDVYIEQQDGNRLHFVVEAIESYPYKDAPAEKIFAHNDAARLNLVTCEGVWVKSEKTYDHRLVVFTKLVAS